MNHETDEGTRCSEETGEAGDAVPQGVRGQDQAEEMTRLWAELLECAASLAVLVLIAAVVLYYMEELMRVAKAVAG